MFKMSAIAGAAREVSMSADAVRDRAPDRSAPCPSLCDSLRPADYLASWLRVKTDGLRLKPHPRTRAVAVCFGVTQQHQEAMVALLGRPQPLVSSALALVRLQFEAYVRGEWLALVASDEQFSRYSAGCSATELPSVKRMIEALESLPEEASRKSLSDLHSRHWHDMCGLTHTGIQHLARWTDEDGNLGPQLDEEEMVGVIGFASRLALLASMGIALLSDDEGLSGRLRSEGEPLLPPMRRIPTPP